MRTKDTESGATFSAAIRRTTEFILLEMMFAVARCDGQARSWSFFSEVGDGSLRAGKISHMSERYGFSDHWRDPELILITGKKQAIKSTKKPR